ncbi:MAG: SIMPL domain-containing protein [Moraxella sp.]|nr:SIMPL domain-containing protein [Moraxella sp.]
MTTLTNIVRFSTALTLGAFGLATLNAHANPNQSYNHISFSVEAQEEVDNDEIQVRLSKTAQAKTAKEVAKTLNKTINDALAITKKYPNVSVKTGHQSTYPNYGTNNTITGFTGSASIQLKSQNFEEASQLIADLQTMMAVNDISFSVSDAAQKDINQRLTLNAAKRFQEQAQTISLAFGATDYKIVSVRLGEGDHYYARPMAAMAMAKDASAGIENPNFEGGKTILGYQASGTIELIK